MIRLENVTKAFKTGESALSEVNLLIEKGDFVFFTGPSGSGKTTLFRLLIREMLPSHGSIVVNDWEITKLPKGKVPHLRRKIGVVFQDLKLLMDRTIGENIVLPLEMSRTNSRTAQKKVNDVLAQVGILEHKDKFPIQLSGGELQRAAIARALVFSPDIVIADEPTGNLDTANSWEIVKLLQEINATGTTVLMATHNNEIVNNTGGRVVVLEKGRIIKDEKSKHTKHIEPKEEKSSHQKVLAAIEALHEKKEDEKKHEKKTLR